MQKMIPIKELYGNLKKISDDVENWTTFVVLKYSKPVYKISPIWEEKDNKKYNINDISKFIFKSKNEESNLALNYKKYIY